LCLAQEFPAAVIDTYVFPTTATAGCDARQSGPGTRRPPIPTTSACRGPRAPRRSAERAVGLGRLLQHRDQGRHLGRAGPFALSKCYNLDGSNPSYDVNNQFCSAADARCERPAATDRDAVPEPRRA
jgi:hypothetical protein